MFDLLNIDTEKLNKFLHLLDFIDYDQKTKTLIIDQSIKVKIKGNYSVEADKHIVINSNFTTIDPELEIPYSVFFNSDEKELKYTKKKLHDLMKDIKNNDEDCGCHQ